MNERRAAVRKLAQEKLRPGEIARRLNVPVQSIYRIIKSDPSVHPRFTCASACGPLGSVKKTLEAQNPDFLAWLASARPAGTTVAEFLIACAIDAFHEEQTGD